MSHNDELSELIADVREQLVYMKELGIELLDVGAAPQLTSAGESAHAAVAAAAAAELDDFAYVPPSLPNVGPPKPAAKKLSRLMSLPSLSNRAAVKAEFGPTENSEKVEKLELPAVGSSLADALFDVVPATAVSNESIADIRNDIGECTRCPLYSGRTQVVHSTGNFQADLMFVGEAPGADEDEQGFPFVGRAGQLLTKIIEGIGYKREDVFIGNINRCRPPANRAPTLPEAHTCRPFLLREIAVVKPKVIVVMGNTALHNLLDTKDGITKVRGQFQDYFGVKVMPTFHPAYLLRDPHKKREVWEDMKKVRDHLKEKG